MAGCLSTLGGGGGSGTNVAVVYALGGLGDKAFNDMAKQGVDQAQEEYEMNYQGAEPSGNSDFPTLQRRFAESSSPDYDLVSCIGFAQAEALTENADQYGDQQFMIVDAVVEQDNVASYVFKEHLGSFQVGHLAGLLTQRDFSTGGGDATEASTNTDAATVGFVGGMENSLIKKFEAGFIAGAKHAGDVDVRSAYAGSWSDPAQGKEIALSMYEDGADIVYHAAGGTGTGVFGAAQEQGRYAIGVDSDQSKSAEEYQDVILASMVKHVDTAVYTSVENVVNDEHAGGEVSALGLEAGGVEAVLGQTLESEIPSDVKSALEDSKSGIVNGDISVPTNPDDA
ncbi:BMP family protein [Halorubellus sp. JP-L1]|uniref:BMP family lipoprotein n=1 Tax=Halorubellus sp. JP-L1 TaxID=2715753 RepID=UPI001F03D4FF|nr:BMP family protein [Halorubellus sp. JP-L1]